MALPILGLLLLNGDLGFHKPVLLTGVCSLQTWSESPLKGDPDQPSTSTSGSAYSGANMIPSSAVCRPVF